MNIDILILQNNHVHCLITGRKNIKALILKIFCVCPTYTWDKVHFFKMVYPKKLISGTKFSWNVDCFRMLFPSLFVDFLNKYKYLSVKNNWIWYMTKIRRFFPFTRFLYISEIDLKYISYGELHWENLFPNRKFSEHFVYE